MTTVTVVNRTTRVEVNSARKEVTVVVPRQTVVTIARKGVQGPPGPPGDGIPVDPDLLLTYTIARDT